MVAPIRTPLNGNPYSNYYGPYIIEPYYLEKEPLNEPLGNYQGPWSLLLMIKAPIYSYCRSMRNLWGVWCLGFRV